MTDTDRESPPKNMAKILNEVQSYDSKALRVEIKSPNYLYGWDAKTNKYFVIGAINRDRIGPAVIEEEAP